MTPAELLQTSGGYWSTCTLHAAVKLDIFTLLEEQSCSAEVLCKRIGGNLRAVSMLLDALVAMKLLDKDVSGYSNTPGSRTFLTRSSGSYLGHIIMHHHQLMTSWNRLDQAVITGAPLRPENSRSEDPAALENFLMGMHNLASLNAPMIVPKIDLGSCRRLLDLGGGPGSYAIHFCLQNPNLWAVVFDLPSSRPFAERNIESFGLADRICFSEGDILTADAGSGFDVVWISHVLHSEGPQGAVNMLLKAASALKSGGRLLIQEFILEDDRTAPLFPALFSLNMLLGTEQGQAYSMAELGELLNEAGFINLQRLDIKLVNGAGIISATLA